MAISDPRLLHPDELDKWFDHLEEVFRFKSTPRDYFVKHYHQDPFATTDDIIVVVTETNEIASSLRIFRRKMWMGGQSFNLGGIGEVSTKKAFEKQGLAQSTLKFAIDRMQATNVDISSLHTRSASGLYAKLGWQSLVIWEASAAITVASILSNCGRMEHIKFEIADLTNHDILAQMSAVYSRFACHYNFVLDRSEYAYWQRWFVNESIPSQRRRPQCFVARSLQSIVAYMIVEAPETDNEILMNIKECVWDETLTNAAPDILRDLFALVLHHFSVTDRTKVTVFCAPYVLRALPKSVQASFTDTSFVPHRDHMIKLLHPVTAKDGVLISSTDQLIKFMTDGKGAIFFRSDSF